MYLRKENINVNGVSWDIEAIQDDHGNLADIAVWLHGDDTEISGELDERTYEELIGTLEEEKNNDQ